MCNTSARSLIQWKLHIEINNRYVVSTNKVAVVVVKITIRSVSRSSIFWSPSRGHVTKGQAWACILEFGTPPFPQIGPHIAFAIVYACAKKVSPEVSKILPLTSCSGRAFIAHMTILWAFIDRWRNSRAQRVSFKKLVQIPLHVSPNLEFLPLPTLPGKGTPWTLFQIGSVTHPVNFSPICPAVSALL